MSCGADEDEPNKLQHKAQSMPNGRFTQSSLEPEKGRITFNTRGDFLRKNYAEIQKPDLGLGSEKILQANGRQGKVHL